MVFDVNFSIFKKMESVIYISENTYEPRHSKNSIIKGGGHILQMMKAKSVDDERILVNNKEIHVNNEGIGIEYYIQKLFN